MRTDVSPLTQILSPRDPPVLLKLEGGLWDQEEDDLAEKEP